MHSQNAKNTRFRLTFGLAFSFLIAGDCLAASLEFEDYDPSCGVEITQDGSLITASWPVGAKRAAAIVFDLAPENPLINRVELSDGLENTVVIARAADPMYQLRIGRRDLRPRNGWTVFFDRMQRKPNEVFSATTDRSRVYASSVGNRATLTIGELSAGPFRGEIRWTFFAGHSFVLQEAVVATEVDATAFLYDVGLTFRDEHPTQMTWRDAAGVLRHLQPEASGKPQHLAVRGRSVCATFEGGSLAVFPPPHRYFYPLDFSNNLQNVWIGPSYGEESAPFGFGLRHDPAGDNRFVPWFNAPPGTKQELGLFLLLADDPPEKVLQGVSRLSRDDRFKHLPGHTVFSSHYHVEHTEQVLKAQTEADASFRVEMPSGETYLLPERLRNPGFARMFRAMGVEVVHLAEFHFGRTPKMNEAERIRHLEVLHAECRRLSDDQLLLLPGEEPNVHFGGHWISLFPKPVYWVLNRPQEKPFVADHPELGRIYHVGGEAELLRLLRDERGLAWTAHPRIKSSTGFPDRYRDQLFFQSDRFLGAAWKAMPADLSQPRLGTRVLDLLDDMSNWGHPKYVLGEVDVFKIEPDHELYGHMNVNYLRLEEAPEFEGGWQPILDVLRDGAFFVTTGEVLIPRFSVADRESGETARVPQSGEVQVQLDLEWTFPLAYAELISGDGESVRRHRVDLSETDAFGEQTLKLQANLAGQRWVRVEVWDVATNGAFTQPVWLEW